jgi:hypothetical protein
MSQPDPRYGRWIGAVALVVLVLITINTVLTTPNGATGLAPGSKLAPFAVPLVTGTLQGEANVATHAEGKERPACTVRGPRILNVCQLSEGGPLVLALFVDSGGCEGILSDMQSLMPTFPGVRFAAVSLKGDRVELRELVRRQALSFPVGIDGGGVLAALYKVASCPQITFAYPGGVVQSKALLLRPPLATLRARVSALVAGARARGWRPPS